MKNTFLQFIFFTFSIYCFGQKTYTGGVGINTENPQRTLDINGNLISNGKNDKWFFENPGISGDQTSTSYLTVIDNDDNKLKLFDPEKMSYSSINYTTFRFNRLPNTGLESYDTLISTDDYHVIVGGFIIYGEDNKTRNTVSGTSTTIDKNVLYSSRAKIGPNKTWILTFKPNNGAKFSTSRVDIVLNVAIYRKNLLLLDTNETITVDMKQESSGIGSAPKPVGIF